MLACKVLWEPFQHGSDSAVLLKMFCAICGFMLPVNLAEESESVVADSALSTQLKEDDGVDRVDSEPSNSSWEENNLEVRTPISQDIGSDLETEAKARSDRLPSTSENVQKNPKGGHGREWRKPQCYSERV